METDKERPTWSFESHYKLCCRPPYRTLFCSVSYSAPLHSTLLDKPINRPKHQRKKRSGIDAGMQCSCKVTRPR